MNFYQLNSLMSGDHPYELTPINMDELYPTTPDAKIEIEESPNVIQTMEIQNQIGLKPLDSFEVGIRPSYSFDKFGTPVLDK